MIKILMIILLTIGIVFSQAFLSHERDQEVPTETPGIEFSQNPILLDKIILEEPVDPDTYVVGPGDTFSFNMVSADGMVNLLLEISPVGEVLIPVVGIISVIDLTLTEAIDIIKSKCIEKYGNASIYLTLYEIRKFKILVTGTVNHPGFLTATPFTRVSDIFDMATEDNVNILPIFDERALHDVSLRNIKLIRNGNTSRVDLLRFYITGEKDLNPRVQPGDVVSIGLSDENVQIYGGIKLPGSYEFVERENLYDLIKLAGGFTNNADSSRVEITRFINDTKKEIIHLSKMDDIYRTVLMPEDHIIVRLKQDYKRQELVTITGEVKYPGKYALQGSNVTVGSIIEKAGGYTDRADQSKILVNNQSIAKIRDIEYERIALIPYENRSDAEKAYVKARSRTVKGTISSSSEKYTNIIMDFPLQIDDVISIPPKQEYVELLGAVVFPGRYPLIEAKSIEDYILEAGGLTHQASRQKYIVKNSTGKRITFHENDVIENGDIIFIAEKLEYNRWMRVQEIMTVGGQMAAIIIVIQNAIR